MVQYFKNFNKKINIKIYKDQFFYCKKFLKKIRKNELIDLSMINKIIK
jgi:hypothetical protein